MIEPKVTLQEESNTEPRPGFWKQILVTFEILAAAAALFGGIWLLESTVIN